MPTIDLTGPELVWFNTPSGTTALVPFENFTPPEIRTKASEADRLVRQYDNGVDAGEAINTFARAHVDNPTMLDGLPTARLVRVVQAFRDYAPIRAVEVVGNPAWELPQVGIDPGYSINQEVEHSGKNWRSKIDANYYEPSAANWAAWQDLGAV